MTARRARRLPGQLGSAGWLKLLPDVPAPVVPEGDLTADFAIIGAGFAGLSAARRLHQLQPGAKIVVLEALALAEGASGRNSGFMIDLPHDLTSDNYTGAGAAADRGITALNRHAIAFAAEAVEDYAIAPAFFDRAGKVNGAASAKADALNRSYGDYLTSIGEGSEWLDAQAMQELTGSRHYHSGLYTAGTVMLQPAAYIIGLAQGLRRDGVQVFEHAPVRQITRQGSGWLLACDGANISAGRVIMANNGHVESFGFARHRLMHVFLYASMSEELDAAALRAMGGAPHWGITPSDPMGTTIRRIDAGQGGNRIITRSFSTYDPGMEPGEASLKRATRVHRRKFIDRFPQLASVRQEWSWAGPLCMTWNDVSIMRELDTGLYAACVCNGLGTTRSTLTGIGAAELACGQTSAVTRHFAAEAAPACRPRRCQPSVPPPGCAGRNGGRRRSRRI